MPVEVGMVVEGIVTGITNFGAFVQLEKGQRVWCIYPRFQTTM